MTERADRAAREPVEAMEQRLEIVDDWSDVPEFADEAEEAQFWATHDLGEALLDQMQPVPRDGGGALPPARLETQPARPRTRPVAVRLDEDVLRRLRALATKKHKGYQTLLKEFVTERLYEEEKREGILAADDRPRQSA